MAPTTSAEYPVAMDEDEDGHQALNDLERFPFTATPMASNCPPPSHDMSRAPDLIPSLQQLTATLIQSIQSFNSTVSQIPQAINQAVESAIVRHNGQSTERRRPVRDNNKRHAGMRDTGFEGGDSSADEISPHPFRIASRRRHRRSARTNLINVRVYLFS